MSARVDSDDAPAQFRCSVEINQPVATDIGFHEPVLDPCLSVSPVPDRSLAGATLTPLRWPCNGVPGHPASLAGYHHPEPVTIHDGVPCCVAARMRRNERDERRAHPSISDAADLKCMHERAAVRITAAVGPAELTADQLTFPPLLSMGGGRQHGERHAAEQKVSSFHSSSLAPGGSDGDDAEGVPVHTTPASREVAIDVTRNRAHGAGSSAHLLVSDEVERRTNAERRAGSDLRAIDRHIPEPVDGSLVDDRLLSAGGEEEGDIHPRPRHPPSLVFSPQGHEIAVRALARDDGVHPRALRRQEGSDVARVSRSRLRHSAAGRGGLASSQTENGYEKCDDTHGISFQMMM